ncbi:response regulator transcription factor [Arsenicicoccus bolidensis]|uniref:response regulator transcription factor n=1 Tax=Arsenicicoccus bolidensis TaxID=229480 RepID=UPI000492CB60|nr:response regulator transcription factor [Arsenicicoccus bolidensis]
MLHDTAAAQPGPTPPPRGVRALVVEDDLPMATLIGSYLEREGYEVDLCHDGVAAVQRARELDPDVVVLDIGLPGQDGVEVCRQLRTFSDAYVVMLTARADELDTLIGLSVGADDYMTKPFSPRELVARLRAMQRRPRPTDGSDDGPPFRRFGTLTIDPNGRDVWLDDDSVSLTRTEFDLLAVLSARPGMAFSRRQLIDQVWGESWVGDEHLVDVHVGHLRRKLGDDAGAARFIRTVRGIGYRMGTGE